MRRVCRVGRSYPLRYIMHAGAPREGRLPPGQTPWLRELGRIRLRICLCLPCMPPDDTHTLPMAHHVRRSASA